NGSSSSVSAAPQNQTAPPKRLALARSTPAYGSSRLAKTLARRSRTSYELRDVTQICNSEPPRDEAAAEQSGDVRIPRNVAAAAFCVLPGVVVLVRTNVRGLILRPGFGERPVDVAGLTGLAVRVAPRVDCGPVLRRAGMEDLVRIAGWVDVGLRVAVGGYVRGAHVL